MMFDLQRLVRPNITDLKPYSSARSDFEGSAEVFLDANENAFGSPAGFGLNRYPDPLQRQLKYRIAAMKGISPTQIFVGNGSDEAIDLLFRIFCEPGRDNVIICPPTYGMYGVSADINDVAVGEVKLTSEFQPDVRSILEAVTPRTKLIFICSPNNPTGNLMRRELVMEIVENFDGIVVVDEAYIDFAEEPSIMSEIHSFANLVVLQTFSKAWGMAGVRVGLAFAGVQIIGLMNRVKSPYNVSAIAQQAVVDALDNGSMVRDWIETARVERLRVERSLGEINVIQRIFPSDANFLLVKVDDASGVYRHLIEEKIVVRNRSNVVLCEGCLRMTIGTPEENNRLLDALVSFEMSGIGKVEIDK
jgi:histidinol-phosphate aminotransferase